METVTLETAELVCGIFEKENAGRGRQMLKVENKSKEEIAEIGRKRGSVL